MLFTALWGQITGVNAFVVPETFAAGCFPGSEMMAEWLLSDVGEGL